MIADTIPFPTSQFITSDHAMAVQNYKGKQYYTSSHSWERKIIHSAVARTPLSPVRFLMKRKSDAGHSHDRTLKARQSFVFYGCSYCWMKITHSFRMSQQKERECLLKRLEYLKIHIDIEY